ncbi:biotin--[acetyl-CoA-carboxylase] ligase [Nitrospirillum iridis]|uniref:biotin--[biotin carboxyl-carrier protein] ligase n=1 Tax=Nitrospirillum iridis TaxID=765888 RepID=A0A7X0AWY5_9PROT|nr:biotin--[acetyl-CoA-carboxylase] ligase [Nitrospirillum iridis]MBB6251647.1 BirA family biotin operon repressor/biotin-[acetyl-CoA-carboxylase] ligase [Nitrospirillum iridis]
MRERAPAAGTPSGASLGGAFPHRLPDWIRPTVLERCGSTNDIVKDMARTGAPEGALVRAVRQEAGRGRRGRSWLSDAGNLACTLLLRPGGTPQRAAELSFVTALAAGEAVDGLIAAAPKLKWPNDILVDGAKIAGILLESEADLDGSVAWVAVGMGMNVRHHPDTADYPATSLLALGADVEPDLVMAAYAGAFDRWYRRWQDYGFAPVRAAWLNAAQGLGGAVTVRLHDRSFDGRLVDLDVDGALLVETAQGSVKVSAGDVFFPILSGPR